MKKAILMILFLFTIIICLSKNSNVFAAENNTSNQNIKKITMIKESFSNVQDVQGEINRIYKVDDSKEIVTSTILLPDRIFKKIKDTKDPLFEAKQELTVAYRFLRLEKRLQELNGMYVPAFPHAKVSIDETIQPSFQQDISVMNQFADSEVKYIASLSKTKQEELYDTSNLIFADYGKELDTIKKNNPNFEKEEKIYKKEEKVLQKEKDAAPKTQKNDSSKEKGHSYSFSLQSIILLLFTISIVFGLTMVAFKKRR